MLDKTDWKKFHSSQMMKASLIYAHKIQSAIALKFSIRLQGDLLVLSIRLMIIRESN